jgi:hypothetical protein
MVGVFWFHPMAHWAYRRVRLNNELCCDDDVVRSGVHPADYVDTLMSIVAGNFSRRGFVLHLLGDSTPGGVLRKRMHYVLRDRPQFERRPILAYVTVAIVLATMPRFLGHGSFVEVLMTSGEKRLMSRDELASLDPTAVDHVITPGIELNFGAPDVLAQPGMPVESLTGGEMLANAERPLELPQSDAESAADSALTELPDGDRVARVTGESAIKKAEEEMPAQETSRGNAHGTWMPPIGVSGRSGEASGPILPPRSE